MDYEGFRHFADSWGLVYLFVIFVAAIAYTFRPGSRKIADKVARIPLQEDSDND